MSHSGCLCFRWWLCLELGRGLVGNPDEVGAVCDPGLVVCGLRAMHSMTFLCTVTGTTVLGVLY